MIRIIDSSKLELREKGDCVDWLSAHTDATTNDLLALPMSPTKTTSQDIPQMEDKNISGEMYKPDHLDLANIVMFSIGRENLLSTTAHVFIWSDKGIWITMHDKDLKKYVQNTLQQCEQKVMCSLVDSVAKVLTTEIYAPDHEWDKDTNAINFLNGELHWNNGSWELLPHNRENYRTTQIPHDYDRLAQCPRFKEFLAEIFRDDADRTEKSRLVLGSVDI